MSGGLARGAAQLAFVREVIKKIGYERLVVLSSSSIGSLNAYAVSCNSMDEMIDWYRGSDFYNTAIFSQYVQNSLFDRIFLDIEKEKMLVPTYATGTRLTNFETYYFYLNKMTRSEVKNVISISMSFPFINGPRRSKQGKLFLDGGATDNVPVYPLIYEDLDMIIILHCFPKYRPPLDIIKPGTVWIDVDTTLSLPNYVTSFSLAKDAFNQMADMGEKDGKEFADFIFSDFNKDDVKKRCHEYLLSHLDMRAHKKKDNLMKLVDFLNCLADVKGYYNK